MTKSESEAERIQAADATGAVSFPMYRDFYRGHIEKKQFETERTTGSQAEGGVLNILLPSDQGTRIQVPANPDLEMEMAAPNEPWYVGIPHNYGKNPTREVVIFWMEANEMGPPAAQTEEKPEDKPPAPEGGENH
ncbi:unnamed protein product [Dibothriocephalus latus]|uniref:Uncharacterized protein n=1 Tax=Dibothriocephalus latus TaxID=60516 RepID=A0A3P7Q203_DIBLA|nr:unnamed protein product [Dibothriocephalus latus]